jgi:hypothetical protein
MNAKKFSDAMSELDTKYVDEALNYKKKSRKPVWVKWGAMAAYCSSHNNRTLYAESPRN